MWWPVCALVSLLVFFLEILARRSGMFQRQGAEGAGKDGAALLAGVAENYLRMAKDFDAAGNQSSAQEYYLKAHAYFLKAQREEEARRMWERYRLLEERRNR